MVFGIDFYKYMQIPEKKVISFKIRKRMADPLWFRLSPLRIDSNKNRIPKNRFKIPILLPKESIFSRIESESNIPSVEGLAEIEQHNDRDLSQIDRLKNEFNWLAVKKLRGDIPEGLTSPRLTNSHHIRIPL